MSVTKILSPAKVNLGLWLVGKRSDGYHDILTVFHAIDLCDEIEIREGPLRVETSTGIPQEENLVFKALAELQRRPGAEPGALSIYINKKIPVGAGLGGGSSNVASVLKEVNRIIGEPLSEEELIEIGGMCSSDVPFFFRGGTALGMGRGDILEEIDRLELEITLLVPNVEASTNSLAHICAVRENT
ncbi:MAG: hypothetical protein Q9N34_06995 [Aquificota bacterium]|nr:hypothetical protein [Aquificota bacterium]